MAKKKQQKKKEKKEKKVSYNRQPEELSLREWQVKLRQQYGQQQEFKLTNTGEHPVWSDFKVFNPEGSSSYRVAIRGEQTFDNYCDCYDYKVSGLGTCKHIEWALHKLAHTYGNKQHFKKPPLVGEYSSVYLHYGEQRTLRIRIGTEAQEEFTALAQKYFDDDGIFFPHAYLAFDEFLQQAQAISSTFRCYQDALAWVIDQREDQRRAQRITTLASQPNSLDGLIKAKLYDYQREGVLFAAQAGRCLLADEMGLGKTIQALATAELYRREYQINTVFIICPTSLKYQWRAEIEKFTDSTVIVVEGSQKKRTEQYAEEAFYKILTYNVVVRDLHLINQQQPDFIILDEAQRIKNWDTKISRAVKQLQAPFRLALTGTPLENKLEDLYSIVQFLDQFLLGPLYLLLYRHQVKEENGIIIGYRNLDQITKKLSSLMLRRRKKDVLKQLPKRVDKHLFVPMTPQQRSMHSGYENDVAQIVAKWKRLNFLTEADRLRLMSCLQLMRMSCNSTFLVDQQTRYDTKIDELFYILEERLAEPHESVVIFSQWSRMTKLIAGELEQQGIPFVHLHGGVPSAQRGPLLDRFREDDDCRVFLSTDAGGLGLNLQKASLVINMDLPWNPAVLEQRIARAYRMGQKKGVQVINLVSEKTIEHRMLFTLNFKSALAQAVLEATEKDVFMDKNRFEEFMERLQVVTTTDVGEPATDDNSSIHEENLERPSPAQEDTLDPAETLVEEWWEADEDKTSVSSVPVTNSQEGTRQPSASATANAGGPQQLVNDGISFLSRLTQTLSNPAATEQLVNSLVKKDEKTGETYLKIPVENADIVQNGLKLLSGLLGKLG
ncbi:MAG: DEAD/DEAH box helicase [Lewinella sp.]|uniref:DEAD/DEAH box helicase n=1 Tax=Lewinella sp. TaxID=2004506 RepID=UPI003D6AD8A8